QPDRDEIVTGGLVLHRVDPGAAELAVLARDVHRPWLCERVDQAVQRLWDLPDLLDAQLPHLRLPRVAQLELLHRAAGQMAPAASRQHRPLSLDVGAGLEVA